MKSSLTSEQKAERAIKTAALLEIIEFCNENNIQWQNFQIVEKNELLKLADNIGFTSTTAICDGCY